MVTSCQLLSTRIVPVSRRSRAHTSRQVERCSVPPLIDTRRNAHSRKRVLGPCGSSNSACSKSTVSKSDPSRPASLGVSTAAYGKSARSGNFIVSVVLPRGGFKEALHVERLSCERALGGRRQLAKAV